MVMDITLYRFMEQVFWLFIFVPVLLLIGSRIASSRQNFVSNSYCRYYYTFVGEVDGYDDC